MARSADRTDGVFYARDFKLFQAQRVLGFQSEGGSRNLLGPRFGPNVRSSISPLDLQRIFLQEGWMFLCGVYKTLLGLSPQRQNPEPHREEAQE